MRITVEMVQRVSGNYDLIQAFKVFYSKGLSITPTNMNKISNIPDIYCNTSALFKMADGGSLNYTELAFSIYKLSTLTYDDCCAISLMVMAEDYDESV